MSGIRNILWPVIRRGSRACWGISHIPLGNELRPRNTTLSFEKYPTFTAEVQSCPAQNSDFTSDCLLIVVVVVVVVKMECFLADIRRCPWQCRSLLCHFAGYSQTFSRRDCWNHENDFQRLGKALRRSCIARKTSHVPP